MQKTLLTLPFYFYKSNMNKAMQTINKSNIKKSSKFPAVFRINDRCMIDNTIIANAFNSYVSNIGREIVQQIINHVESYQDFLAAN